MPHYLPKILEIEYAAEKTLELPTETELHGIVCGLPRGATNYMGNLLRILSPKKKHNIRHEGLFGMYRPHNREPRKDVWIDVTGFAAPWLYQVVDRYPDVRILHVVRHPVAWINSFVNSFGRTMQEADFHWEDWCWSWDLYYRWNATVRGLLSTKPTRLYPWTVRVEDIRTTRAKNAIEWFLDCSIQGTDYLEACTTAGRGGSTAKPFRGSWENLPPHIHLFAKSLGYVI